MGTSRRHLEATERHLGGWRQLKDTLEAPWRHLGGIWEASAGNRETSCRLEATERHLGGISEASSEAPNRKVIFYFMF